jgi:hypothetical protein
MQREASVSQQLSRASQKSFSSSPPRPKKVRIIEAMRTFELSSQVEERRWVRANLFPQFLLMFHLAEFDAADLA